MPILAKKRTLLPLGFLLSVFLLSACKRNEQEAPSAEANPRSDALKVAFVYTGPVSDGGWSYAHDQARRTVEAALGDRIATTYVENVPDGADSEQVFRDLAKQGNRVIFGTSFGYMEPMLKVAKEYPEVKFEHATGHKTAANLSVYEARTYEGAYLAGILAGKTSKSGKLGFVASVPIPEVIRNINAFTLGAQSVNPSATTRIAWVHRWFDTEREREAALELIGRGADVLIQNTDSPAVLRTAQEKGVHAFGWDSDMTQYGPKAHLGSAVIDWSPYYKKVVNSVLDGTWQSRAVWWGAKENMVRIASPNPALAHDVLLFLGEKTHALKTGKLRVFGGPLVDLNGREVIAAGQEGDDAWLKDMNFFVKGVLGEIPR
jgi:simple sugar transport system substrate-binding protein